MPPSWTRLPVVALGCFAALVTASGSARAWVEVHVASDDVRVALTRDGHAQVEHKVTLRISGGPLRSFEIVGVDRDAVVEPNGYVVPVREAGSLAGATPITVEVLGMAAAKDETGERRAGQDSTKLHVRFEGEHGLSHGVYLVVARYTTDFAGRGLLARDGSFTRLKWQGARWEDGLESARAVFELPSAPTEPRADDGEPAAGGDEPAPPPLLGTVRRGSEKDELELVRPYAPKGEPVLWTVRMDPRALRGPSREPSEAAPPAPADLNLLTRARRTLVLAAAAGLFLVFAMAVALKFRSFRARAAEAGATARPLIPAPLALRAPAAGLCLVAGIALELLLKTATAGALLVAAAMALAAHRAPHWTRSSSLRRPGHWLPISETEAFRKPPRPRGALLDVSTRAGKLLLVATLAALGGLVALVAKQSGYYAYLLALDGAPLLAIFCTGRLLELPPDPALEPSRFLQKVAKRIRRRLGGAADGVRLVPRIHVPDGSPDADELRLCVMPRTASPGFVAIEIGLVYAPGAGGSIGMPEVLLRVVAQSEAERLTRRLSRHGRTSRGRKPNECVVCFTPRLPTARMTAAIATTLAAVVTACGRSEEHRAPRRRAA